MNGLQHYSKGHFVYVPSQWEEVLHSNVISYWLGTYAKWPLLFCIHADLFKANSSTFDNIVTWSTNMIIADNLSIFMSRLSTYTTLLSTYTTEIIVQLLYVQYHEIFQYDPGLCKLNGKTVYHQISWKLEVLGYRYTYIWLFWNLTGTSSALLLNLLSNFRPI